MPPKSSQKSGKGSQKKGEKSKMSMDQEDTEYIPDPGPGSGSDTDGNDSDKHSGDSSDEEEEDLMNTSGSDQEMDGDVDNSNVGGASTSDVMDLEEPGPSCDISCDIVNETIIGEDDNGNVSDGQESQFERQLRGPFRSISDLSTMSRMRLSLEIVTMKRTVSCTRHA